MSRTAQAGLDAIAGAFSGEPPLRFGLRAALQELAWARDRSAWSARSRA